MNALIARKETARQTPTLYLVYGYREIDEPNRWYVGSCLYMREQARDNQHRRRLGAANKFRRELNKVAAGRCFDEIVQKVVLEIVWGTPQDAIDRENIHMDRLDSIQNGFNSRHAGFLGWGENNKGKTNWSKGVPKTEEQKLKLAAANIGNVPWNKGKKLENEETRRKLVESHKGQKAWNKGKKHSEETLAKMRGPRASRVKQTLKLF